MNHKIILTGLFCSGLLFSSSGQTNILKGIKASYENAPTYVLTHNAGDVTDLTDGVTKNGEIWFQKGSVGWKAYHCGFLFDLGKNVDAGKIRIHTTLGRAGVRQPEKIYVLGSLDGKNFELVSEIVQQAKFPAYSGKWGVAFWIESAPINKKMRYLRFVILPDRNDKFFFLDEVELYPGKTNSPAVSNTIFPGTEKGFINALGMETRLLQDIDQVRKNALAFKVPDNLLNIESLIRSDFNKLTAYRKDSSDFPLNQAQKILAQENQRILAKAGFKDVIFSWVNRYDVSHSFSMPKPWNVAENMTVFPGERRNFAFQLTNPKPKAETVEIRIDSEFPVQVNKAVASVSKDQFFNANRLEKLSVTGKKFKVTVHPGETVLIFGRVSIPLNAAKKYQKVSFVLPNKSIYSIPVEVCSGWKMPQKFNTRFGMWDYLHAKDGRFALTTKNMPQVMELIRDSKLDWTWISDYYLPRVTPAMFTGNEVTAQINYSNIDYWLANMSKNAHHFSIFFGIQNKNFVNIGIDPAKDPAGYKARIGSFMKKLASYMQNKWGVDPRNVSVLTWDEAWAPEHKLAVKLCAQAIKESGCGFKSFSDAAVHTEEDTFTNVEILNPLTPYLNGELKLHRKLNEKRLAANKELMWGYYRCNGRARDLDPYTYYGHTFRTGWFFDNFFGGGFWQLSDAPKTLAELDHKEDICCALYYTRDKVYSTRQFESIYEAREDFEYLYAIKKLNKKLAGSGKTALVQEGNALAEEITRQLESELEYGDELYFWYVDHDRTAFDKIRYKCAKFIEKCAVNGLQL